MNTSMPHRRILKETVIYGAGTFLSQVLSGLRGMMVAKMLGPAAYGFWKVIQVGIDYLSYAHVGFLHGLARQVPFYRSRGEGGKEAEARTRVLWVTLVSSFLAGVFAVLVTIPLPRETWFAWIGLAVILIPAQLFRYLHMTCLADGRFAVLSGANLLMAGMSFVVMYLAIPSWGIYGVFAGLAIGYGCGVVLGWGRGIFVIPSFPWSAWHSPVVRDLLTAGFPFMCVDGLFVIWQGIDRLALASLYGARSEAMGHYGLAVMIASFATQIPQVVNRVLFRRTVGAFTKQVDGTDTELIDLRRHVDLPTFAVAGWAPVLLAPCLLGSVVLIHLFLPEYSPAITPTALQLLSCYWIGVGMLVRNVFTATNRQWRLGGIYLVAITITVGTIYLDWGLNGGHSRLGISAGGVGALLGALVAAILSLIDTARWLKYSGKDLAGLLVRSTLPFLPFAAWTWWVVTIPKEWDSISLAMVRELCFLMITGLVLCAPAAVWVLHRVLRMTSSRSSSTMQSGPR